MSQCHPIIQRTNIDHTRKRNEKENTPQGAFGSGSGGFEPKSIGESGVLDAVVKDLTPPPDAAAPSKDVDVVAYGVKDVAAYAMKVVKSTSERDEETFSRYALWRGPEACLEEIMKFESELKAGELKNVQNLPALLTERLREITII